MVWPGCNGEAAATNPHLLVLLEVWAKLMRLGLHRKQTYLKDQMSTLWQEGKPQALTERLGSEDEVAHAREIHEAAGEVDLRSVDCSSDAADGKSSRSFLSSTGQQIGQVQGAQGSSLQTHTQC